MNHYVARILTSKNGMDPNVRHYGEWIRRQTCDLPGFPGSGKMRVITELYAYKLQAKIRTLLSCAINEALDVCTSAVRA